MVALRRVVERTFTDRCNIMEKRKVLGANKATMFKDALVLENVPCRLSFKTTKNRQNVNGGANEKEINSEVSQIVKVFIPLSVDIKDGSWLEIIKDGKVYKYKNSGLPAVYSTHKEIILATVKGFS